MQQFEDMETYASSTDFADRKIFRGICQIGDCFHIFDYSAYFTISPEELIGALSNSLYECLNWVNSGLPGWVSPLF
jgi:hypothetical protein